MTIGAISTVIATLLLSLCACNQVGDVVDVGAKGEPSFSVSGVPPTILEVFPDGDVKIHKGHDCQEALNAATVALANAQTPAFMSEELLGGLAAKRSCVQIFRAIGARADADKKAKAEAKAKAKTEEPAKETPK